MYEDEDKDEIIKLLEGRVKNLLILKENLERQRERAYEKIETLELLLKKAETK